MIKRLLLTVIFTLSYMNIYPQWNDQNLASDGNYLWSTFSVDDTTSWIEGFGGLIKKTSNAGLDWIQQNSGTTLTLKSVQFINFKTGWICVEGALIFTKTDGGRIGSNLQAEQHSNLQT
jgi:photosystem II stability/assembly factor-like uncharacterized protein